MQLITYLATFAEGQTERIEVRARSINSGYAKALRLALQPLGNGRRRELASLAFAEVA